MHAVCITAIALSLAAQEPPKEGEPPPIRLKPIVVIHAPADLSKVGSVQKVEDVELETFEYDDATQLLQTVPSVNFRGEDGFGLRPNIGIRGASSERSKKVTLMEDGILFAPAPYSAPAAYYFPMMQRIVGLEVYKGPGAVLYGPHTIGGAINLRTRDIPYGHGGGADISYGIHNYVKGHLNYGAAADWGGLLFEGVHLQSDGFKELDGGADTGFRKTELTLKGRLNSDPNADLYQAGEIKLGFNLERSHETYLGLTDGDFADNPYRRYAASGLDQLDLWRTQAQASYSVGNEAFDAKLTLYRHDVSRAWRKLNDFAGGTRLSAVLADPSGGTRGLLYDVLAGKGNSEDVGGDEGVLLIGTNGRNFVSQGVDLVGSYRFETGPVTHEARLGLRYHFDSIVRDHREDRFNMVDSALVADGSATRQTADNVAWTHAFAGFVNYNLFLYGLTIKPGVRLEAIQMTQKNSDGSDRAESSQLVPLAGLGVHYEFVPNLGVLAGVHQGFSPVSPGQSDAVTPETAINYELGFQYADADLGASAEIVAFYSDYNNLLGQCSFSAGCGDKDLDAQFNAGEVDIVGVEVSGGHTFKLPYDLVVPLRASYTFTWTRFATGFQSQNPQYGDVEEGDELPYVPAHQATLRTGIGMASLWALDLTATYVDAVREVAGQGEPAPGEVTDASVMLDAAARYSPLDWLTLYLRAENLLNAKPIASRRPFGARPSKPFLIMGGLKFKIP